MFPVLDGAERVWVPVHALSAQGDADGQVGQSVCDDGHWNRKENVLLTTLDVSWCVTNQ